MLTGLLVLGGAGLVAIGLSHIARPAVERAAGDAANMIETGAQFVPQGKAAGAASKAAGGAGKAGGVAKGAT
jgi:hypothetical protein